MISYYSWDNFDEQKILGSLKKHWDFTTISLTTFFNGDLTEAHGLVILDIIFDAEILWPDLAGKWLGSEGIRRLVS